MHILHDVYDLGISVMDWVGISGAQRKAYDTHVIEFDLRDMYYVQGTLPYLHICDKGFF